MTVTEAIMIMSQWEWEPEHWRMNRIRASIEHYAKRGQDIGIDIGKCSLPNETAKRILDHERKGRRAR